MHALTKKWLKGLIYAIVFLIVLITAIVWGLYWIQTGRYFQSTGDAYITTDSVTVRSPVSATVASVNVEPNQRVSKGELLVTLAGHDNVDAITIAKARITADKASALEAKREVEVARAEIARYRAQLAGVDARSDQALTTLNRTLMQISTGAQLDQRLTDDQANSQVAKSNVASTRALVVIAEKRLAIKLAAYQAIEARIQVSMAEEAAAEASMDNSRIYSPIDGVVGNLATNVGEYISPATALMQIVPLTNFHVIANFKETQIARMRIGQPVSIKINAYPSIAFRGVIESLSPATDSQFRRMTQGGTSGDTSSGTPRVPVRIALTGPRDEMWRLQSGLSAEPEVDTRQDKGKELYAVSPIINDAQPENFPLSIPSDQVPASNDTALNQGDGH